ncbi:Ragulator complex protein lamtor2 [Phlyctochytrium planicorne]|nr:Ragulator complex protein lamtor2 [Phlyctochytrium planicorne]
MLKSRVVSQVLAQANTGGVKTSLLLHVDGSLIAFSGGSDRDAKVVSAIASNIWVAYERHTGEGLAKRRNNANGSGSKSGERERRTGEGLAVVGPTGVAKEEEGLKSVLVQCEFGKLSITNVSRMLLCLVAGEEVEFGMLKAKTKTIKSYLEEPLDMLAA